MTIDVRPTDPPSMKVLIGDDDFVEIKEADKDLNRIDRVFYLGDELVALSGVPGAVPQPPQTPNDSIPVAQIYIGFGVKQIKIEDIVMPHQTGPNRVAGFTIDEMDPFEGLLVEIVETNRRKRADYATPDDVFANFRANAKSMGLPGYTPLEDCKSMVFRKLGRCNNLRYREPVNETLLDSYLDLAVYSILLLGLAREEAANTYDSQPPSPSNR